MKDIVTRCGYRCDLCLAYKENISSREDQQRISDGWFKYYGFRIPPEQVCCDGCLASDSENPRLMDPRCPVRPCVIEKGLQNCAYCNEYICKKLEQRIVDYKFLGSKFEQPIPKEDYENFIKPYEAGKVLDDVRRRLRRKYCNANR